MSRRRLRLHHELSLLATELKSLERLTRATEVDEMRAIAVRTLEDFLLPRLAASKPFLLIALVGSTGAGKSTLLNSLAGEIVSPAGVLRPTTKASRYWASLEGAVQLVPEVSHVLLGSHPLLQTMVLVDTPDLDSDLIDHRAEALAVADRADGIVFLTTASRYGDAIAWETLTSLAVDRVVAVVINRMPSRASGARTDLLSRLRRAGLGHITVFTISEQRIDPSRPRLPPQATQRLAAYLRTLTMNSSRLESAVATTLRCVSEVIDWLERWNQRQNDRSSVIETDIKRLQGEVEELSTPRRRWRRNRSQPTEILRRTQEVTILRESIVAPISLDALNQGRQVLVDSDFEGIWNG